MAHTTSIIVMTLGTGEVILVVVVVMVMFLVGMQSSRQQRRSSDAESHCVD